MGRTLKGRYLCEHPEKYRGNPSNIIYRSSWERSCMNYFDRNASVKWWQSEEKFIPYFNPVAKKMKRYFPDFIIYYENNKGNMVTEVIEVKPKKQVEGPNPNPKRRTKAWLKQVETYVINMSKWKAAREYCEDRGWYFRIITEDQLGLNL